MCVPEQGLRPPKLRCPTLLDPKRMMPVRMPPPRPEVQGGDGTSARIATGMDTIPASSGRSLNDGTILHALGGSFRGLPNPANSPSSPAVTAPITFAISGGRGGVSPRGGSGVSFL